MTCRRCGMKTPRLNMTQRYCPTCQRDVDRLTTERPVAGPAWLRRLTPRDMTGLLR